MIALELLKPFAFGVSFLTLNAIQQCNIAQNRPLRASLTCLLMGVCLFAQTRYVATGKVLHFAAFQTGAAVGVALGTRAGNRLRLPQQSIVKS